MKLLFVFTGGTIGSTVKDGFIGVDAEKSHKLMEMYRRKYTIDFDYDIVEPYIELSENNSGNTVRILAECVAENSRRPYDGIIVIHGTDTLQYSACAVSYTLGAESVPVCFVSSDFPVENKNANGLINLHGAIRFIADENPRGVWVSYKNTDENLKIHRGTRLISGKAYSAYMESVGNMFFGFYDDNMIFHKNPRYSEKKDEIPPLSPDGLGEFCDFCRRIIPYPGMKYPSIDKGVKYIIHESYHSGTINSKQSDLDEFLNDVNQNNVKLFLAGIYGGDSYESTKIFSNKNIYPVLDIAPIAVFMKVWMAYSSGISPESIINKSLGGDIF